MPALPAIDYNLIADLSISSLELDRRSSPASLPSSMSTHRERSLPVSPLSISKLLRARTPAPQSYQKGSGSIPPSAVNNKGVFALFGLIFAGLVLTSIWFFFWAKNGGFQWRGRRDWEDYKSTVLRRKGPNGTTLSGATKTTELGGGSIVGGGSAVSEMDLEENSTVYSGIKIGRHGKRARAEKKKKQQKSNNNDSDVRAYRHEKPAKVGGLNREPEGSYHDYTNTDPSELSQHTPTPKPHKAKPSSSIPTKKQPKPYQTPTKPHRNPYAYPPSASSTDSHRPLRQDTTPTHTPTRSRQSSPRKHNNQPSTTTRHTTHRSSTGNYTEPLDFSESSRYTASETAESEGSKGTKAYFHPIPGLGREASREASRGACGGGFRRGGGGGRRRDSLSDSEGETVMS
ncbi:hypothetical protein MMC12_000144 [Toensbergia leucococca]|nr:hypothetical protein [Toensbergia leucococca]